MALGEAATPHPAAGGYDVGRDRLTRAGGHSVVLGRRRAEAGCGCVGRWRTGQQDTRVLTVVGQPRQPSRIKFFFFNHLRDLTPLLSRERCRPRPACYSSAVNGGHDGKTPVDARDPAANRYHSKSHPAGPKVVTESEVGSRMGARPPAEAQDPPLALIEWEDSFGCSSSWADLSTEHPTPLRCRSVGWIVHQDAHCVVIVPHVTDHHDGVASRQGCGDMTIPARAVVRVVTLDELGFS